MLGPCVGAGTCVGAGVGVGFGAGVGVGFGAGVGVADGAGVAVGWAVLVGAGVGVEVGTGVGVGFGVFVGVGSDRGPAWMAGYGDTVVLLPFDTLLKTANPAASRIASAASSPHPTLKPASAGTRRRRGLGTAGREVGGQAGS